jgi:hypothetical protein
MRKFEGGAYAADERDINYSGNGEEAFARQ